MTLVAVVAGGLITLLGASPASASFDSACGGTYDKKAVATGQWETSSSWTPSGEPTAGQNVCVPSGITLELDNNDTAVARSMNGGGTVQMNGNSSTLFTLGSAANGAADSWIGALVLQGTGNSGTFTGTAALSIGTFTWTNVGLVLSGTGPVSIRTAFNPSGTGTRTFPRNLTVDNGATVTFDGPRVNFTSGGTFTNNGTVNFSADNIDFQGGTSVVNNSAFNLSGAVTMLRTTGTGTFTNNAGASIVKTGAGTATIPLATTSGGTIDIQGGGLLFSAGLTQNAGTSVSLDSGESLTLTNGFPFTNSAGATVDLNPGSTLSISGGGDYVQTGSTSRTIVDGSLTVTGAGGDVDIQAGQLQGDGAITAETLRNAATLRPGALAAASLSVTGNFVQTSAGTSRFDVWSGSPSSVAVSGSATLDGKLGTTTWGAPPAEGSEFNVLTYNGRSGLFTDLWDMLISTGANGLVYVPNQSLTSVSLAVADIPTFSVDDVAVSESAGVASFTITRSGTTGVPSSVRAATAALGTNKATAGVDYTAVSGTQTFNVGETTKTVNVTIANDSFGELTETFQLKLSVPRNGFITDPSGLGQIGNDDGPPPTFSVADVTVGEGSAGNHTVNLTITRGGDTNQAVSVKWKTRSGSAKSTTGDFTAVASTLVTFAGTETQKTISVTVNGDTTVEPTEAFTVVLERPVGGTITDGSATVTLTNDD